MRVRLVLLLAGTILAGGTVALAQGPGAGDQPNRVRVSMNGGSQATKSAFTETRTFEELLEQGSLTMSRSIPTKPFYDGGASVRLWRGLTIGVAASHFEAKGAGTVDARIPHPFFFNRQRAVSGQAGGINRKETAGHVQIAWVVPATERLEFTLAAGPSVFAVQQVLISNVAYKQEFPYDIATFDHAVTEVGKANAVGYNAGVDLTWRVAPHLGLGGVIRFSRGTMKLRPSNGDPVSIETGGLHAGGGLRLMF